ncbi:acetate--CoA ligase family protein [Lachnospiraceae bacterium ZAX-1]
MNDMKKLMAPESVVVVGATDKPGMPGGATASIIESRIKDRVYYLNPNRDELYGRKCYHSLSELPEIVDCMVIGTPAKYVPGYLDEGGALGIGAAVVFASGFEEERTEEGQNLAREVREICTRRKILLCGPNCVGIVNGVDKVHVSPGNELLLPMLESGKRRGIGLVAQSGYITSGFTVPDCSTLAYAVSAGNCAVCSIEDYLLYFAENDDINCIAAYIEGIKNPELLEKALKTAALKHKPFVVLKAGATEKGQYAAASHTGSMAGDYKIVESVFKKYGAVMTNSLQDFSGTARMFALLDGQFPKSQGVGAICFSGGENTMCADISTRLGIDLPDFNSETTKIIQGLVPSYSTASNPLDATTTMFAEDEKVHRLFEAVCDDEGIGLITVGDDVQLVSEVKDITCLKVMSKLKAEGRLLPSVIIPSFERLRNPEVFKGFENAGVPVLSVGEMGYRSIRHLLDFSAFDAGASSLSLALPESQHINQPRTFSEIESYAELSPYGIPAPRYALAQSETDLPDCLANISFPIVMKIVSADIPHKTDAGAVVLGINSYEEAIVAFRTILNNVKAYHADAHIEGIALFEMAKKGTEVIIGIKNDKQFGPVMLVGLGGVFTELFQDMVLYPCPISEVEAERILKSLKSYRLLSGYRGTASRDVHALVMLMARLSEYAVANKDSLVEMDLNPVFVYDDGLGVSIADALIVKADSASAKEI